jgi:uracil phosphoribosyltransferase
MSAPPVDSVLSPGLSGSAEKPWSDRPPQVTVVDHPLVQHKLTLIRKKDTSTSTFRNLVAEVGMLLAYEVTRDLPLVYQEIETPLAAMRAPVLEGKKIVLVSILRAGNGLLDGMLRILPSARVGHIGLYRDPETLGAVEYYFKIPNEFGDRDVIAVAAMLATGHSAVAAVDRIKQATPKSIKFVCLLAAREGIAHFNDVHPDVPVFTAAIDEQVDEHGFILPGLGDAGDRLFGTSL